MKVFAITFCAALFCIQALSQSKPMTFDEIVSLAYSQIESVKLQQIQMSLSKESLNQLESRFYPKLSFLVDYTRIQEPTSTASATSTSAFTQTDQYDGRLSLTLLGIQGYREYYGRKAASLGIQAQQQLEENTKRLLFVDLVDAYYALMIARADLGAVKLLAKASDDRNREIARLVGLGRSRNSDLLQQKTQAALANVALVQAMNLVRSSENRLRSLGGLGHDVAIADDTSAVPNKLLTLDEYLNALDTRADVVSMQKDIETSNALISVARADYFPSLDLKANVHAFRSGVLSTSYWDVGFALTVPLFEGFKTASSVRTASLSSSRKKLLLEQAKRVAAQEIQARYDQAFSLLAAIPALEDAQKSAERYYESVRKDFALRTVNNLDVNLALNDLYNVKRRHIQSLNQFKAAYKALLAISGRKNEPV